MATVHLILAHPGDASLNHTLYTQTKSHFQKRDYEVVESNLYQMYAEQHPATLPYGITSEKSQLIAQEQEKVKNSQLTVIQFPLYWFSLPAIVHAYMEQIFTPGFAYPGKFAESPLHDGRRLFLSLTSQSTADEFTEAGCNGTLEQIVFPITVAFQFVGYQVLPTFAAHGVHNKTEDELKAIIQQHMKALEQVA